MKNPFKIFYHWIRKQLRKRDLAKRDQVYDDVIGKLDEVLTKKGIDQKKLTVLIHEDLLKFYKIGIRSKFIPEEVPDKQSAIDFIYEKYGAEMERLSVKITGKLHLVCT